MAHRVGAFKTATGVLQGAAAPTWRRRMVPVASAQASGARQEGAAAAAAAGPAAAQQPASPGAAAPCPIPPAPPTAALVQRRPGRRLAAAPTETAAQPATEPAPSEPGGPAPAEGQPDPRFGMSGEAWGKLCLLGVALLWGSYAPFLRLLYSQDGPPGPVAIMLFRGVLQACVLVAAYSLFGSNAKGVSDSKNGGNSHNGSSTSSSSSGAPAAGSSSQLAAAPAAVGQAEEAASSSGVGSTNYELVPTWAQRLSSRISFTGIAATELGLWLFMATAIQTLGLQLTTATRASFLIQATALLTPVLASLAGQKPTRSVWLGCLIALAGCLFIAADNTATDTDDGALFSLGGDAAILSAAFFYSLATVRLGTYARFIPAVELAAAKSVVLGGAAAGMFAVAAVGMTANGDPLTDLWPGYASSPLSWGILVWSALGPGALAAFLHAKGQAVVPPADAQVIFSTVPLWSVAFAFLLLGGEPMSEKTWIGGSALVAAGLIASRKSEADNAAAAGKQGGTADKGGKQS